MVQTAGRVNVVPKNHVGFYDFAGTYTLGDGSTATDVTPKTAAELADAGAIVAASDVKALAADFATFVRSLDNTARS